MNYDVAMKNLDTFVQTYASLFNEPTNLQVPEDIDERVNGLQIRISLLEAEQKTLENDTKVFREVVDNHYDTFFGFKDKFIDRMRGSSYHQINQEISKREAEVKKLQIEIKNIEVPHVKKMIESVNQTVRKIDNSIMPVKIQLSRDPNFKQNLSELMGKIARNKNICRTLGLSTQDLDLASEKIAKAWQQLDIPNAPTVPDQLTLEKASSLVDEFLEKKQWFMADEDQPEYFQQAKELINSLKLYQGGSSPNLPQLQKRIANQLQQFETYDTPLNNEFELARKKFEAELKHLASGTLESIASHLRVFGSAEKVPEPAIEPPISQIPQARLDEISSKIKKMTPEEKRRAWIFDRDIVWGKSALDNIEAKETDYQAAILEQNKRESGGGYDLDGFLKHGDKDQLAKKIKDGENPHRDYPKLKQLWTTQIAAKEIVREKFLIDHQLADLDGIMKMSNLPPSFRVQANELFFDQEKLKKEIEIRKQR